MMTEDFKIVTSEAPPPRADLNIRLMCPECCVRPPRIIEDFAAGDLICADCGLIIGDRIIDTRSEWRTFANEDEDPSRVGNAANPFLDGTQLDTLISKRDGGTGQARILARMHGKASAHLGERQLVQAYKEISALCEHAKLSRQVGDVAKQLFKQVRDERLCKGKDHDLIVATCIYLACRYEAVTRTFKEISAITRVGQRELGRCFKMLSRQLGEKGSIKTKTVSSVDLIVRFCSKLGLETKVANLATVISERSEKMGLLDGKSPVSIAAACIFMAAAWYGKPKHARDIQKVTGVSEITIKGAYKKLWGEREPIMRGVTGGAGTFGALPTP